MLHAITTFYDSHRSPFRLDNFKKFRRFLRTPLTVVELASGGAPFQLSRGVDAENLIQIRGDCMWQKERCLNLALASLPSNCDAVLAIDADVWLDLDDSFLEDSLKNREISQPYYTVRYLKRNGNIDFVWEGAAAVRALEGSEGFLERSTTGGDLPVAHGIAWAFRRDFIEKRGFYDALVVGGGDLALSFAVLGHPDHVSKKLSLNPHREAHYLEWALNMKPAKDVGWMQTQARHLWHGNLSSRRHAERKEILANFNPHQDLITNCDGAWEWSPTADRTMIAQVNDYFVRRAAEEREST